MYPKFPACQRNEAQDTGGDDDNGECCVQPGDNVVCGNDQDGKSNTYSDYDTDIS